MHELNAQSLLSLYSQVAALKLLPRTGWLQRGIPGAESVAEHIFGVAVLALLVGDSVAGVDRGKLLAIALIHDLAEALLGDLPASARRLNRANLPESDVALEEISHPCSGLRSSEQKEPRCTCFWTPATSQQPTQRIEKRKEYTWICSRNATRISSSTRARKQPKPGCTRISSRSTSMKAPSPPTKAEK